jgi:hypothetical protein
VFCSDYQLSLWKVSRSDIALKIICGHEILTATHKLQLHPTAFYSAISEVRHRRGWFTLAALAFKVQFDEDDQVVHAGVVVWVHERFVERAS